MDKRLQLWTAIQELMQAFGPVYQEAVAPVIRDYPRHWQLLRAAAGLEPQPLTLQRAHQFAPYLPEAPVAVALETLQSNGMLQADGAGEQYYLTVDGDACVRSFYETAQAELADVALLPAEQMVWLRDTLRQLVETAATLPEPQDKMGLIASRWSAPQKDGPLAPQIDQYLTDLYFFRDDAHVAAWKPSGLSGPSWEALTFIWRDQAHTAQELAEQLQNRTLAEADWAVVLEELAGRNLIEEVDGSYQLTAEGRAVREDAETVTDQLYFAAFAELNDERLEQLLLTMEQARDHLRALALHQFWPLLERVSQAIFPPVKEHVTPLVGQLFSHPSQFFYTRLAREIEPEPYTPDHYLRRYPYTNYQRVLRRLQESTDAELLERDAGDRFRVTERGRDAVDTLNGHFYQVLGELELLPQEQMIRLVTLLERLVQAALDGQIPRKDGLLMSHNAPQPAQYAPLARIDQLLDDLTAFREDMHIAAWTPYNVDARDWETLTLIWRGEAHSPQALAEKLSFQGYTVQDYERSAQRLLERGWLQSAGTELQLTVDGRTAREEAEARTDDYFSKALSALDDAEQGELRTLLIQLKESLQRSHVPQEAVVV